MTVERIWRNGYWPIDPEVEAYLKERILIAEPDAKFTYCKEFREECKQADREAAQKARREAENRRRAA